MLEVRTMNNSLTISVVVCAYTEDRWEELVKTVESVQRQTISPHELIVVIDHNPALLVLAQRMLSGVVLLENWEQQGLSGARNSGTAVATGEVIAFIDDDAIAAPDWLMQLTKGYQDARVLGTGGAIIPMWLNGAPRWFPEEFHWVVGCTYRGLPRTSSPVRNIIGCNMSFRREVLKTIRGFRPEVGRIGIRPMGCEETELCIRVMQRWPQGVLLYQPRSWVYHRVPPNRASWRYFRQRCYAEGLSKAQVARLVNSKSWLTRELSYSTWTLPQGIVKGLADCFLRLQPAGLARAGAIAAGLAVTTAGYLRGTVANSFTAEKEINGSNLQR
jgi:glycosyltransferase involved in cell wall biosynthesis